MAAQKIVVTCGGCAKTQAARPSTIEPCDGYYCMPECGPKGRQPPGLLREYLVNAVGGFWGWRDVAATLQARDGIARARAILALGQAKLIVDVAAGDVW